MHLIYKFSQPIKFKIKSMFDIDPQKILLTKQIEVNTLMQIFTNMMAMRNFIFNHFNLN